MKIALSEYEMESSLKQDGPNPGKLENAGKTGAYL